MIFEENTTKKKGNKTITNNITRTKVTIQDGNKTTTLPYAILTIQENTVTIKQGTTIATIPKSNIPEDVLEILIQQTTKKETPQKTTTKGKKEKDEDNDKKTK